MLAKLVLWIGGVIVAFLPLLAAFVLSGVGWSHTIGHGELILITISVLTGAIAYSAMNPVASGFPEWVKALVVGSGLAIVVFAALAYSSISDIAPNGSAVTCLTKDLRVTPAEASRCLQEPTTTLALGTIATISYVLFLLGAVVAILSIVSRDETPPQSPGELK